MIKKILASLLLMTALVPSAYPILQPVHYSWDQVTESVNGDSLDINGDGDYSDGLTGYKLYKVVSSINGTHVDQLADLGDWRKTELDTGYNYPEGEHCFVLTAYFENREARLYAESGNSNIVCKDWKDLGAMAPPSNFQIAKNWIRGLLHV